MLLLLLLLLLPWRGGDHGCMAGSAVPGVRAVRLLAGRAWAWPICMASQLHPHLGQLHSQHSAYSHSRHLLVAVSCLHLLHFSSPGSIFWFAFCDIVGLAFSLRFGGLC